MTMMENVANRRCGSSAVAPLALAFKSNSRFSARIWKNLLPNSLGREGRIGEVCGPMAYRTAKAC